MTTPFMRAYSLLTIKTCHKRNAFAMGGMAAQIPIKNDPAANEAALEKVRQDKRREATDGHDGTWVAHPGLVQIALEEFDAVLGDKPNQIDRKRDDVEVKAADLLEIPKGEITEKGLRVNISVGIQYIEAWLRGLGCVPLYNLMEDAATAEISRTQVWQWVHNRNAQLNDGRRITMDLVRQLIQEELENIQREVGDARYNEGEYQQAAKMFDELVAEEELAEFLTLDAYKQLA
jgi:malate synthase